MLNKEFHEFAAGIHVPCIDKELSGATIPFSKPDYGDPMNKTELVEIAAKEADLSKAAAASALDAQSLLPSSMWYPRAIPPP